MSYAVSGWLTKHDGWTTTHIHALHIVEASGEDAAKGLAITEMLKNNPGFAIANMLILPMVNQPTGSAAASTSPNSK